MRMAFSSYKKVGNAEAINGKHKVDQFMWYPVPNSLIHISLRIAQMYGAIPTHFPSIAGLNATAKRPRLRHHCYGWFGSCYRSSNASSFRPSYLVARG